MPSYIRPSGRTYVLPCIHTYMRAYKHGHIHTLCKCVGACVLKCVKFRLEEKVLQHVEVMCDVAHSVLLSGCLVVLGCAGLPLDRHLPQIQNWLTDCLRGIGSLLEAMSSSACQEITCILWNRKVQYRVHNNSPEIPVPSHMNPIHAVIFCFFKSHLMLIFSSKCNFCAYTSDIVPSRSSKLFVPFRTCLLFIVYRLFLLCLVLPPLLSLLDGRHNILCEV
jgi:hypothetical protein